MQKLTLAAVVMVSFLTGLQSTAATHPSNEQSTLETAPRLETLLTAVLEGVEGTEVIVSRVTIPPNTSLPKHWHPGEEFAYVLEGSVTLWQKGKEDLVGKPGDVVKIPLKQIHTAITSDEGATVLVFRVHEQGQPERFPVEDD
jgi:quercetin dioxygenase-like cupin family protein